LVDCAVDDRTATAVSDEHDRLVGGIDGLDDRSHVIGQAEGRSVGVA
jgi:hypothetical protein